MAADPNMGFHLDASLASAFTRHGISFQSGAINSTSGMIPVGSSLGVNSTAGMILSGNSSSIDNNVGITLAANSSGGLLLDSVPGLKHDTELAVEWSVDEQCKLEEGLVKFDDEPNIMRYIRIAATLRDKTVRDVALRCRWMTEIVFGLLRKNIGGEMQLFFKDIHLGEEEKLEGVFHYADNNLTGRRKEEVDNISKG
ncbi:hypothetical protein HHK36_014615 [Tetracentron sinense]|uniref:Uncharacterized protein n=1 Tax=Tetracentron sinense TaxID=13715 RepID=A0A834Z2Y7_TETSI|nr:hypothetical protein HHK36_014615 [Tetracentron sinense]